MFRTDMAAARGVCDALAVLVEGFPLFGVSITREGVRQCVLRRGNPSGLPAKILADLLHSQPMRHAQPDFFMGPTLGK